jgi:oxygen-independent coproporphyrinogen-3 oxidase
MAGIYLHIPFCKQACNYCNFHFTTSLRLKDDLLTALKAEIGMQKGYLEGQTIETIYFGGGTPSLLNETEIMQLWDAIELAFPNQQLKEVTLEANPDNLTREYLKALKGTPINRLSIGIQSFQDKDLQYMNRAHNAKEADYAVKAAQDMGFENISIDLIYGTPTMTDKEWLQNITTALALKVPHISSYALTVEPKTALAHAIEKGNTKEPDNSQTAHQFEQLMQSLTEAGFDHYEISNFALPGKYAIHNTNYWKGKHYLGLGPSAHSFNGSSRQWNIANNPEYIKSILVNHKVSFESEKLSFENRFNEYIMISLRTMWGADLNYIKTNFGGDVAEAFLKDAQEFIEDQKMTIKGSFAVLTSKGKLLADKIASELFI